MNEAHLVADLPSFHGLPETLPAADNAIGTSWTLSVDVVGCTTASVDIVDVGEWKADEEEKREFDMKLIGRSAHVPVASGWH